MQAQEEIAGFKLSEQQQLLAESFQLEMPIAGVDLIVKQLLSAETCKVLLQKLSERHEALRTTYPIPEGLERPVQLIQEQGQWTCVAHDLTEIVDVEYEPGVCHVFHIENNQTLLRVGWIALQVDAGSLNLLVKELDQLLSQQELEPVQIPYTHFSGWQQEMLEEAEAEIKEFWKKHPILAAKEFRPALEKRLGSEKRVFEQLEIPLPPKEDLLKVVQEKSLSPTEWLKGCWLLVLSRHAAQEQLTIGQWESGRVYDELDMTLGLLDRYLPYEVVFNEQSTLPELLENSKQTYQSILDYQEYFTTTIAKRDITLPYAFADYSFKKSDKVCIAKAFLPDNVKLRLEILDISSVWLTYDKTCYSYEVVQELSKQLQETICQSLIHADEPISQWGSLALNEERLIAGEEGELPKQSVIDWITSQARTNPHEPALFFDRKTTTYQELQQQVDRVASWLQQEKQIVSGSLVAIRETRSDRMVIAILAVLQTGAAYVPIDVKNPDSRVHTILQDAQPQLLLGISIDQWSGDHITLPELFSNAASVNSNEAWPTINVESTAYILYTSGTTGKPKGCAISHQSLANYIQWANQTYSANQDYGHFGLYTSIAFDLTITSIFSSLTSGKSLHVFPDEVSIDQVLREIFLESNLINTVKITPSHIRMLKELELETDKIKVAIVGGEALEIEQVQTLKAIVPDIAIFNEYGPTEATVGCVVHRINEADDRILIGKPIQNMQVAVVDAQNRPVPIGVTGELLLSGAGLAKEYWNDPRRTNLKFVENLKHLSGRWYRTGDFVRQVSSQGLEYLGRQDNQVKIRGYRIELEEVTKALLQYPSIQTSVVLPYQNTGEETMELAAWVIVEADVLEVSKVKNFLSELLPDYMIPSFITEVDQIPLTVNGKVDQQALPKPGTTKEVIAYEPPRNHVETQLADIWQGVLKVAQVGVYDNFFELGGQSLKGAQVVARIHKYLHAEVSLRDLFAHPTIANLASFVDQQQQKAFESIPSAQEQEHYPLSNAQRRLWILHQMEDDSIAYNMPAAHKISGPLQVKVLQEAFQILVDRHESLRTTFKAVAGEPRQWIHKNLTFELNQIDLSEDKGQEKALKKWQHKHAIHPFDLTRGPLFKATLLRLSDQSAVFLFNIHHIISDGWSEVILVKELFGYYEQLSKGQEVVAEPLTVQYKDYATWQIEQMKSSAMKSHGEYWLDQFADSVPPLNLPLDFTRPAIQTYRGATQSYRLTQGLTQQVQTLAQESEVSLFMFLMATCKVLLHRYTGQQDIVVGSPVAGREHVDLEEPIGFFVNTLALRDQLDPKQSFTQILDQVSQTISKAYEHQHYPFDDLVDALGLERDLSHAPLFDVMLVMQNNEQVAPEASGLHIEALPETSVISKFDLTFNALEEERGLRWIIDYNTDLFKSETIERLFQHLENLLRSIVADPHKAIAELNMIPESEQSQLEHWGKGAVVPHTLNQDLISLWAKAVAKHTDLVAVKLGAESLTYRELDQQANQVANFLLQEMHLQSEERIAVCVDRSLTSIILLLGILKAGGAYVPLEPDFPSDRVHFILQDSSARAIITDKENVDLKGFTALPSNFWRSSSVKAPALTVTPLQLAYVIYTSGSTGKPKGVLVNHDSFANMTLAQIEGFGVTVSDKVLQFASPAFDASLSEIFMSLLSGGTLVLLSKEVMGQVQQFQAYLEAEQVSVATIPPAYLSAINRAELPSLRVIISAGEPVAVEEAQHYAQQKQFFNAYGPTEASVCASFYRVDSSQNYITTIPIGAPIANTQITLLDAHLQSVPIGVFGEICLSGAGLSRGYLNRPEAEAAAFVVIAGTRYYRTGDLGRWIDNGQLEYGGRKDAQVKIRGHRIEPEEIRYQLLEHDSLQEAIVLAIDNQGQKALAAYFTCINKVSEVDLKRHLAAKLPSYMIPDFWIALDTFPLNNSGKIDRKVLPSPTTKVEKREIIAPENPEEQLMVDIWQQILQIKPIGTTDNFFDLGGNSLKAIQLLSKAYEVTGHNYTLRDIFQSPTIKGLVHLVVQSTITTEVPVALPLQEVYELSPAQQRMWAAASIEADATKYNMPGAFYLDGVVNEQAFQQSVDQLVVRHETLRSIFPLQDGRPVQKVLQEGPNLLISDISEQLNPEEQAVYIAKQEAEQPFDLSQEAPFRARLIRLNKERYLLLYTLHHIVGDAWSIQILTQELLSGYQAQEGANTKTSIPLNLQYKDFAYWHQQWLTSEEGQQSKHYWLQQLSGASSTAWPSYDSITNGQHQSLAKFKFSKELTQHLDQWSQHQDASLFMTLTALVNVWLYINTKQSDLTVGAPIAARTRPEWQPQIGLFMNLLALRTQINIDQSFDDYLQVVKKTVLEAYQHQLYPNDRIINELAAQENRGQQPLFDVEIHLDSFDYTFKDVIPEDLTISSFYPIEGFVARKYELEFHFQKEKEQLLCMLVYNPVRFDESSISEISNTLQWLVKQVTETKGQSLSRWLTVLNTSSQEQQKQRQQQLKKKNLQSFLKTKPGSSR